MLVQPHQLRWIEDNLIAHDIDFVVIGGVAVKFYCPSRVTNDVDLFVGADPATIERLVAVIPQLAKDPNATAKLLNDKVGHFQVEAPYAIDVLTYAPGLSFTEAHRTATACLIDGSPIPILGRSLLISHKQAVGEEKDLEDVKLLSGPVDDYENPQ